MEYFKIETTLPELLEDYGSVHGRFIMVSLIQPFYSEAFIIVESCFDQLRMQIEKVMERYSEVSLRNTISCNIIINSNVPNIVQRYQRCNMADTKVVNLLEENEDYADDSLFNINSWGADLSFRELILMYDDEELVKPDLQRKYVWTKEEASKFIDSLLLGLPVPSIFLAKVNEQKLIIDGYQRIMTVYDYIKGIFSGDRKVFKLTNSESINQRWKGKAYSELTREDQRRIASTTIHAIIFEQKQPANDSGMYKIFERINTSGRNLKPQEIRNCVYHGTFDAMLMRINEYPSWRKLWGTEECDSRMTDVEFVLRFFMMDAMMQKGTMLKQISLKKELNSFMGQYANADEAFLNELTDKFHVVTDNVWRMLGKNAFRNLTKINERNPEQKFATSFHPAIFDAVMLATSQQLREEKEIPEGDLTDKYRALLVNEDFIDCITQRTTNVDKIIKRVSLARLMLFGEQA